MKKKYLIFGLLHFVLVLIFSLVYQVVFQNEVTITNFLTFLASATISTILFIFMFKIFAKALEKKVQLDLAEDEEILFEENSNLFQGKVAIGGKLFLTDKRLSFKSHRLNVGANSVDIDPESIESVEVRKTFGILENILILKTSQSGIYKFVLGSPLRWKEKLVL